MNIFDQSVDDLVRQAQDMAAQIAVMSAEAQVDALNQIRLVLHQVSPFRDEPVDLVLWVAGDAVKLNDYNPNVVHRPEMKLLCTSIRVDHMTMPMPAHIEDRDVPALLAGTLCARIVDGEHRYKTITGHTDLCDRLRGYVPITITHTRTEGERMASTVRHNRARGVHKLDSMSDIVLSMLQDGWGVDELAEAMGMDADEILRLRQVSGIAKAHERPNYNRAWVNDDDESIASLQALD